MPRGGHALISFFIAVIMSSRDVLYRTVLRGSQPESPQVTSTDLSPMSSLAFTLHHGASLSHTPKRRLSLSSNLSDTPQSCHEASLVCSSFLHESHSEAGPEDSPVSPPRRHMSRNKENFPSPYYFPSHTSVSPSRNRVSPLKEVQNTVNRNLNFSPLSKLVSPSKRIFSSPHKPSPPEDFDTNSQDSGYSESGKKLEDDCFSVPVSCAPRKLNLDLSPAKPRTLMSPVKPVASVTSVFSSTTSTPVSSTAGEPRRPFRKFSSLSKGDEEDAMLMDLMDDGPGQLDQQPMGFSSLLSAPIQPPTASKTTTVPTPTTSASTFSSRPSIRRCLSMLDTTPTSSRVQSVKPSLESSLSFKRPQPPTDLSSLVDCKRRKQDDDSPLSSPLTSNAPTTVVTATSSENLRSPLALRQNSAPEASTTHTVKPKLQRSHSESHVSIMKALNKCSTHNGQLTGDFSKPIALPTIEGGKHPDLNAISVDTMAELVRGKFKGNVASLKILDCRYPYEYEGGHIMGAEMCHHPKMVLDHLDSQKGNPVIPSEEAPRHILIFHCEFSAERGPKAQRLLREFDRQRNKEHYPALHFPETYLLEGGYKAFYESYPELCTPNDYIRMLDSNFAEELKHFRSKSKSWAAENKQAKSRTTVPRPGLKRLGL